MVRHNRGLDRRTVPNRIHIAKRSTLHPKMSVRLDRLLVHLVGQQRRHPGGERVHRNTGGPENEVGGDLLLDRLAIRTLLSVRDTLLGD
jgi:hypothetical protein